MDDNIAFGSSNITLDWDSNDDDDDDDDDDADDYDAASDDDVMMKMFRLGVILGPS